MKPPVEELDIEKLTDLVMHWAVTLKRSDEGINYKDGMRRPDQDAVTEAFNAVPRWLAVVNLRTGGGGGHWQRVVTDRAKIKAKVIRAVLDRG